MQENTPGQEHKSQTQNTHLVFRLVSHTWWLGSERLHRPAPPLGEMVFISGEYVPIKPVPETQADLWSEQEQLLFAAGGFSAGENREVRT